MKNFEVLFLAFSLLGVMSVGGELEFDCVHLGKYEHPGKCRFFIQCLRNEEGILEGRERECDGRKYFDGVECVEGTCYDPFNEDDASEVESGEKTNHDGSAEYSVTDLTSEATEITSDPSTTEEPTTTTEEEPTTITDVPSTTVEASDSTTESLESTTESPESTTEVSESTTEVSDSTTESLESTTEVSASTTESPESTTEVPFKCESEGFFPDPTTCTKFRRCVYNPNSNTFTEYVFNCPPGTHLWCQSILTCSFTFQCPERCTIN